jgi:hypothetical protein
MPNELAVSDERFSSEKKTTTTTTTTTTNSKMKKNRGNHLCLLLGTQTSHRLAEHGYSFNVELFRGKNRCRHTNGLKTPEEFA